MSRTAPDYDAYQSSFHDAFRTELYRILDALPVPPNGQVLDVPCGNGFYCRRLAERFGAGGRVTAVDASDEYLRLARTAVAGRTGVDIREASAYELPFLDGTFDLVWCAQSLISLDPLRAVREMLRVAKRGGVVAILEMDEFHHVLLPWPAELEAAIPPAVYAASIQRYGDGVKLAPSRTLRGVLDRAGFESVCRVTHPFDRATPFDRPTAAFLTHYFGHLRWLIYPHLSIQMREAFDRMTDPDASDSLHHRPDVEMVCLNTVYLAS
jgi:ubiquinone/menaquinone biosynthesis C-methylase UbiE